VSRPNTAAESIRDGFTGQLIILGASVRALTESAIRAGWAVHAADLFCDLDLQAIATTAVPVGHGTADAATGYPWSLLAAAEGFPPSTAWCYTGAVENHPDLIDAIARVRPLAGNPGDVVRRLRDPVQLAAAARAAGLSFPETMSSPDRIPLDGTWLVKPLAGAGGRGIRRWTRAVAANHTADRANAPDQKHIWQRFMPGTPLSASFCFAEGFTRLLGVSRQLIGEPWCHAGPFAWCGAVTLHTASGDPPADDRLIDQLERLGGILAARFRPVGLVGVDLVVDAGGRVEVIEVNPRPTASMELFERSAAGSIAGSHLTACGYATPSRSRREQPLPQSAWTWAKAVLFAAVPTPVSQPLIDHLTYETSPWTQADGGWPSLADIPRPGHIIVAGAPVVTIFAAASTPDAALASLRDRVARIDTLLSARV
jgi:predicted ATP-grasp superfamily ATP-dependent carboligase